MCPWIKEKIIKGIQKLSKQAYSTWAIHLSFYPFSLEYSNIFTLLIHWILQVTYLLFQLPLGPEYTQACKSQYRWFTSSIHACKSNYPKALLHWLTSNMQCTQAVLVRRGKGEPLLSMPLVVTHQGSWHPQENCVVHVWVFRKVTSPVKIYIMSLSPKRKRKLKNYEASDVRG